MRNVLCLALALSLVACAEPEDAPVTIETVIAEASQGFPAVRWHHDSDTLTLMELGEDGYYDVWLTDAELGTRHPLSAGQSQLPGKHAGNEDWHPSGEWIVLVAEKAAHAGSSTDALPGYGGYSDVWLVTRDGAQAWQLTVVPDDYDHGTLFPRFSPDGKRLAWNERTRAPEPFDPMLRAGGWVMKVGDFVAEPEPHLENVRTFQPDGVDAFNEATGWAPDSRTLVFASNHRSGEFLANQIYTLDADTGAVAALTDDDAYHEHPDYSPDGSHIVWMTTRDATGYFGVVGTDWWEMRADGSAARRLTYYEEPFHPHSEGAARWPGQLAFAADGSFFYGGVLTDLVQLKGKLVRVTFD
jgi:Tol biopolymer transport system component